MYDLKILKSNANNIYNYNRVSDFFYDTLTIIDDVIDDFDEELKDYISEIEDFKFDNEKYYSRIKQYVKNYIEEYIELLIDFSACGSILKIKYFKKNTVEYNEFINKIDSITIDDLYILTDWPNDDNNDYKFPETYQEYLKKITEKWGNMTYDIVEWDDMLFVMTELQV